MPWERWPQQTIAHYRITGKLGEGGMGAVYRATDTKLGRDVAIKVLPDAFASNAERLARFTREAQVLASLNHPNIAGIYGVEDRALIMELVEGPTLAERIARGPIPLEETLPIAKQIAEALEYAHDRGVVHRDLKPSNIKITGDGRVKVLDFGLAKALENGASAASDAVNSPTLITNVSASGVLVGTAAYMSPEQARGQSVDRRTDIWASGVVLYEMLTGRRLFEGATLSDTLAALLKSDIDLSAIPAQVRRVVERCLRRDPRLRWHCMADARLALEDEAQVAIQREKRSPVLPWIVAAVLATCLVITSWFLWRTTLAAEQPLTRLSVDLGPEALPDIYLAAAISPDGRRLVFPVRGPDGKPNLATRLMDQAQFTILPGTVNGFDPFFSPDGQWLGFFADGELKKISLQGGTPVTLCAAVNPRGASWGEDGNIIVASNVSGPLSRIPAAGGIPQPVTKIRAGEASHRWPQILPGGAVVLFTASASVIAHEEASIQGMSLESGEVKVLERGGYYGRYLPSGHLVFVHRGVLFGVGFDIGRLEVRGSPVPLLEDVAANAVLGEGQFSFTASPAGHGTFLYLPGNAGAQKWQVAWLHSSGKMQPLIAAPGIYTSTRFSPDGRKLAFSGNGDLYVYDLQRETTTRLTSTGNVASLAWAPDGNHIAFTSGGAGGFTISWIRSDGSGTPQRLIEREHSLFSTSFSPDGRWLAYIETTPETRMDVWVLPVEGASTDHPKAGNPEPFLRTPADEMFARFSPDGRWIVYRSDESGAYEIHVRPFHSGNSGRWQISTGGGFYAVWSNNGHELFYETADRRIMVVDYSIKGDSFVPGKPRLWSNRQIFYPGVSNLDVAPDGKRFAVLAMPEDAGGEKSSVHITMLLNFFDELKRRIPVK